ncbi:MAG: OprO/OprP family phosphate-selective porin [Gammaproteobacteria bacterium]|nr:OprO/OprP family phosphate-selective porin [Gammaproteobacteria bacterium]
MKINLSKVASSAILATMLGGIVAPANAANWLMLQGTEPEGSAPRAKVWGFIQPEYTKTDGTKIKAGPWKGEDMILNQMRPDLKSSEGFNMLRARLGVRGTGMPLDSNVNYFLLAEFGNNGITRGDGGSAKVTDASVTLNHLKDFARFRVGTFKTPGSEEGLQAIHVFDYINFTGATNGLLLERFFKYDGSGTFVSPNAGPNTASDSGQVNKPTGPVGAFRDTGIQVFNSFNLSGWDTSYAYMVGNGNGITRGDNDGEMETYAYLSTEKVFGGKGPRRQGFKLFAWNQEGKRNLTLEKGNAVASDDEEKQFDRKRSGYGFTFKKGNYRAAFEAIKADGMIFNGTDGGAVAGTKSKLPAGAAGKFTTNGDVGGDGQLNASFNMEPIGKADGMYLHVGYAITPKLEVDFRYDEYNRMTDVAAKERKFETNTLGVQYFFNKKSRLIINYEQREAEAPNLPADHNANKILDSVDDRLSAQILVIF